MMWEGGLHIGRDSAAMCGGIQKKPEGLDLFGCDRPSGPFKTVRYLVLVHVIIPVFYIGQTWQISGGWV